MISYLYIHIYLFIYKYDAEAKAYFITNPFDLLRYVVVKKNNIYKVLFFVQLLRQCRRSKYTFKYIFVCVYVEYGEHFCRNISKGESRGEQGWLDSKVVQSSSNPSTFKNFSATFEKRALAKLEQLSLVFFVHWRKLQFHFKGEKPALGLQRLVSTTKARVYSSLASLHAWWPLSIQGLCHALSKLCPRLCRPFNRHPPPPSSSSSSSPALRGGKKGPAHRFRKKVFAKIFPLLSFAAKWFRSPVFWYCRGEKTAPLKQSCHSSSIGIDCLFVVNLTRT